VDVDCHHGDAVEEAFYTSERVLTCSFHKFGDFFPGTGLCDDRGVGKGWRYSVNVPFRSGLSDENFKSIYVPVRSTSLYDFIRELMPLLVNGSYTCSLPTVSRRPAVWCRFTCR
jgi:histone deacetylase 1/2